jgi:hypothetical protein
MSLNLQKLLHLDPMLQMDKISVDYMIDLKIGYTNIEKKA